jgi:hypothetical protein
VAMLLMSQRNVGTFGAMGIRVKSNHYSSIVTTWNSLLL